MADALMVWTPTMASTSICWLSAPRLNFSLIFSRKDGRTMAAIKR